VPTSALIARVQAILANPGAPAAPAASLAAETAAPAIEPTLTFAAPAPEPEAPAARVIIPISTTTPVASEPAKPAAAGAGASAAGFVKVDTTKLDALIDLVGELVISESMVVQDPELLKSPSRNLARNLGQLRRITSELQRTAMSLRMVPIKATFQKMTRLVRDLAAKQHKQVQLVFGGEDTELDRNIVEELSDPLVHMIRNSADHGVELPDARVAKGKPALGTIHLRAFHQGGNIVIQIQDDGAGLNKERILAKAMENGLVKPGETLPDKDIFALISASGFSTAEKVTDISGRGVGMDVVRRNIEKLRGKIDIDSVPGHGTTFSIFLPLTLAIIDGMIVSVGGERYIIPTLAVRESFRPRAEMISTVHERGEMVNVRGKLCPLLRLYDYFAQPTKITEPTDGIVVVVESGNQTRCLLVDELIGKQEVVIKSLGGALKRNPSLAGGAVLGDGRVGLILNVDALVKLNHALPLAA
jgi:two-component system chemotaxis sensor kinase CheA